FLTPRGPSPSGFALPAAIAAHLAHPDRRVVCFVGTSELAAATSALETAARLRARVAIIAFAIDGPDAAASMAQAERLHVSASAVAGEARFAQALGRALVAEGPALIVVQP
ncbi:MAG: thiamine pyrophosphate-dependent enzyme, partial [Candidatus Rokuibacteriota bacterium]